MEHLYDYLSFLAKAVTVVLALLALAAGFMAIAMRRASGSDAGHLEIRFVNDRLRDMKRRFDATFMRRRDFRRLVKRETKAEQQRRKVEGEEDRARVFVLSFAGDLTASHVEDLRHEITAVLTAARPQDQVVVRIESAGGVVHGYGLAASQLKRIRERGLKLVAAIDKVAASGGYMMASVADRVIAAPFALLGSIGVIAQVPNVHRLLKRHDIDVEVLTAGQYKRTLTVLGENTDAARQKFQQELDDVHALFQELVAANRPGVDIALVATGESWYGTRALERRLVDELATSDEYLTRMCETHDVYEVRWIAPKKGLERWLSRLTTALASTIPGIRWS